MEIIIRFFKDENNCVLTKICNHDVLANSTEKR